MHSVRNLVCFPITKNTLKLKVVQIMDDDFNFHSRRNFEFSKNDKKFGIVVVTDSGFCFFVFVFSLKRSCRKHASKMEIQVIGCLRVSESVEIFYKPIHF